MTQEYEDGRHWRQRYRPYLLAAALAMVMTMLVAPEINEGNSMEPAIKDGQVIVMTKASFSAKRGSPQVGQVVVLQKNAATKVSKDNIICRVSALPGEKVSLSDGTVLTLEDNEVYLLYDNEEADGDSRTMGPVTLESIRGVAKCIVWPLSEIGGIN